MGYDVVSTGIEGLSGKDTDRPLLQEIITMVNHKRVDNVFVVKLDRLSRDVEDSCKLGKMFVKKGITLHLVTEGGTVDLSDPYQEMMYIMRSAMGQFERRRISMNTRFALARKRDLGERISRRAPYGFRFENGKVVTDADEQRVIQKIHRLNMKDFQRERLLRV